MAKLPVLFVVTLLVSASLAANITVNASASAGANSSVVVTNVTNVTIVKNATVASQIIKAASVSVPSNSSSNTTKVVNKTITLTTAQLIAQIIADAKAQAALILAQSHKKPTKINAHHKNVSANVSHVLLQ